MKDVTMKNLSISQMETIFKHLQSFDGGEEYPQRMDILMAGVRDFNEVYDRSYPIKVTAERYIDWLDMKTKGGVMPRRHEDDSAWSGGFADNH